MRLFATDTEDAKKIDALYQQGEWQKIVQSLEKKPVQEYEDIRILNDLAVAYHQLKNYGKVLEVCNRIYDLEPKPDLVKQQADLTVRYMRYHSVMGEALYRQGEMDRALAIFNELKVVGTRFSDKYYYSGRIHTKRGDYRAALLEFKGMIDNVPQRMRDAVRGLADLIAACPVQAGVYAQLHRACQHKERLGHYLSRYRGEMAEAPGALAPALKVAHLLLFEGDRAGAEKALGSIRPGSEEEKGWLELIRGDWALEEKGAAAALGHYEAAEALLPAGSLPLVERLEELLKRPEAGPDLRRKLAKLCEAGGDVERALGHLEALVAALPGDAEGREGLGRLLRKAMTEAFAANDLPRAQEAAQRLLRYFPDDPNIVSQTRQIEQMLGVRRKEELEGLIATGRMLPSRAARAHYELAEIERRMGGGEDVILSHLQKAAVERSPVRAEALREMGRVHLAGGAFDLAEAVHEILFSLKLPEEGRLEWAYEVAEACEEKGEAALARKYFEMAAAADAGFRDAASRAAALAQQPAAAPAAPAAPESKDPMDVLSRRYDEIVELGRGAMGVVYKARDKILDRLVAIKMILGDLGADPEALGRFITEAQSAAALEHPGIITIYDIRTDEPMFIVMEFVEGKSLGDLLAGKRCPLAHFKSLAVKICEPLAFAHKAEVIHRDLKPDNIMVTKNGGVKIADFGLARKGSGSGMTQVGQVMGTPFYMSPEQIRGGAVDGRSDLYALGIMFYELLTGSVPFHEGDIAYLHMHEEPAKISLKNPEVPKQLEDIIFKCLKKTPEERYKSVEDLLAELRALP